MHLVNCSLLRPCLHFSVSLWIWAMYSCSSLLEPSLQPMASRHSSFFFFPLNPKLLNPTGESKGEETDWNPNTALLCNVQLPESVIAYFISGQLPANPTAQLSLFSLPRSSNSPLAPFFQQKPHCPLCEKGQGQPMSTLNASPLLPILHGSLPFCLI